jgi:DUF1680 family protein
MWNWRLLLLTGDHHYADAIERALYNGILSSPALDGQHYFYVNPLLLRSGGAFRQSTNPPEDSEVDRSGNPRPEWHEVACCPPNVMRLFASLAHYLTTTDARGIQIHQYAPAEINLAFAPGRRAVLQMETDYPWQGRVRISIQESDGAPWQMSLRIPDWCPSARLTVNGEATEAEQGEVREGYVVLDSAWACGDVVELDLSMAPSLVEPHPRVDSVRGSLAIQRGPLVYCLEERDQADGARLLDITIDPGQPLRSHWREDLLGGVLVVEAEGYGLDPQAWRGSLYKPLQPMQPQPADVDQTAIRLVAVPYYAWGNRGLGGMRVWIPKHDLSRI